MDYHYERRIAVIPVNDSNTIEESLQMKEALHDLRLATIRGNLEAVKNAFSKGITVNQPLKGGWTALMYACSIAHPTIVDHLLQQGANPNFHKELFTALMATCASSQKDQDRLVQCVDHLLNYKANINMAERHHITALMFAAKEGHTKVVARLLAESSCDIDARDSQGWTALFWAVNKGETDIVKMLINKKARTDITDRQGQTVIEMAQSKGLHQMVEILTKTPPPQIGLQPDINHFIDSDMKQNYVFGKGADTLLQSLLDELSASIMNNNDDKCGNNFFKLLKNMQLEKNLTVLKQNGQVVSRVADTNTLNGSIPNATLLKINYENADVKKQTNQLEISWKSAPYSAAEAKEVLNNMVKHLESLYASMSYIRLHMLNSPLVEDKHSRLPEITILSEKALHNTRILSDEIYFFYQYAKQLDGSERVVPANTELELKAEPDRRHTRLVSGCVLATAVIVVLFNTRHLTMSLFL